jgi:hypothetical protein
MSQLTWIGLDELKRFLSSLPIDLVAEATPIVMAAAERHRAEVLPQYAVGTKPKRDRLDKKLREDIEILTYSGDQMAVRVSVVNFAKHAGWYEYGTQARHTSAGWNRGAMPARPFWTRSARRHRREMWDELVGLAERYGFTVTGAP